KIEGLYWNPRVREALASTSLGMDFLIREMRNVEFQVKRNGDLSKESEAMLLACGIDASTRVYCEMWSEAAKEEFAIFETELEEELRLTDQSPVDTEQTRATRKRSRVRE